ISDEQIEALIRDHFDLRPYGLVKMLDLIQPIYQQTAAYGHFGREDIDLPWERTDKADDLRSAANIQNVTKVS
ncbi:MAG: methionine adenosyltransferase domain-containing protein, partial [Methylococcales bacterium]|nr:methionine adenosyltransferase domain-containing protein [Methylococcales bacterium]